MFYVCDEVYCVVYFFDYFVWDYLVCEVVLFVDLYCIEDCEVDVVVVDYCE